MFTKYKTSISSNSFIKFLILIIAYLGLSTSAFAKEICVTNFGKDPIAMIVGHSMQWVDPRRGRCINTNEIEALIQNIEVKDVCSFDEKTTTVDLVTYACFRVKGSSGQCSPEIENWEFPEDCEKRVKRSN
ncbi:MAG: hypothetical protein CMJ12_04405 [Pelagibacterales bacterium]|nr:hypothetical protein [Pelagibacterales bacterium]PPR15954.1 MAG: hypothetical protein CFH33_01096 [Alphaproteobacteria bacterium MarineAlpha9_Bin3]|tara:strand:+ start:19008 stop:19400 length:393 start_codon:yes stop_codon:yes gene_type:complete